jgi:hypothetical protein
MQTRSGVTHRIRQRYPRSLSEHSHRALPCTRGFATSRCYHDRGCGTASPRLTNPTMSFPLREPRIGRVRATPQPAWPCYHQVHLLLHLYSTRPLSLQSVQYTKTARRLHAAACCTLPRLVEMHSALPVAKVYSPLGPASPRVSIRRTTIRVISVLAVATSKP